MEDFPAATIPNIPLWSENYAFMVTDPSNNLAVMCLLGRWIENPNIWREFILIGLPGDRVVYHKAFGSACTDTTVSASMLTVDTIKPAQEFRIRFCGPAAEDTRSNLLERGTTNRPVSPLAFDLTLTGKSPIWDMSGHAKDAENIAGKLHIEQVGEANGQLSYNGESYNITNAFFERDHSRGPRDVRLFHRHVWAQGYFPDRSVTFNLYGMNVFGSGDAPMMNATVSKGDRRYLATVQSIELLTSRADGRKAYTIILDSELGQMTIHLKRFIASLPVSFTAPWDICAGAMPDFHTADGYEEAVEWEWDGATGAGWSERAFNDRAFT